MTAPEQTLDVRDHYEMYPDLDGNEDVWCVRLTRGEFAGVIYRYDDVGLELEESDTEELTARFVYDILTIPESLKDQEFEDEVKYEFELMLGNILMDIIQKSMDDAEVTEDTDSQGRLVVHRKVSL